MMPSSSSNPVPYTTGGLPVHYPPPGQMPPGAPPGAGAPPGLPPFGMPPYMMPPGMPGGPMSIPPPMAGAVP